MVHILIESSFSTLSNGGVVEVSYDDVGRRIRREVERLWGMGVDCLSELRSVIVQNNVGIDGFSIFT